MKYNMNNVNKQMDWKHISTQELEDLMIQDFSADQDVSLSPENLMDILDEINRREIDTLPEDELQTAWIEFKNRIQTEEPPFEKNLVSSPFIHPIIEKTKSPKKRNLRWAVAAAAAVCLLVIPVMGGDGMSNMVHWTEGSFYFGECNGIDEDQSIIMYTELENIVADVTNLPVLPSWYPVGTTIVQVEEHTLSAPQGISVVFACQGKDITWNLTVHEDNPAPIDSYEQNDDISETYYAFGIPHYITENTDTIAAVWINRNVECCIQGDITVDELKKMIDSIYQ